MNACLGAVSLVPASTLLCQVDASVRELRLP